MKDYFSKMAGTEEYEVVDMQPAFLRDFQMYEENFEFQCDGHWNELAHFLAREKYWIDGWTEDIYKMIRSESGFVEKDSVFEENSLKKWLFGELGLTTWVTTLYEPKNFRQDFTMYIGDLAILHRAVRLVKLSEKKTRLYSDDSLTFLKNPPKGLKRIVFAAKLKLFSLWLGVMLKYYCEKGKKLKLPSFVKEFLLKAI